ncbi:MAG: hypothetical protein KKI09_03540 [Spirochaetes bacterium]|nr:hypothetical protein [Spirochaetota bacterium]MBU0954480.1 hypothetical protein [Spirochaetota bacterium]
MKPAAQLSGTSLISPEQARRQAWLKARERRRTLISAGSVLAAYLLLLLAVWLVSLLSPQEFTNVSGPVVIRLGRPEGADIASPAPDATALPVAEPTPVEEPQAAPVEQPPVAQAPAPAPTPVPAPASPAPARPSPTPAPVITTPPATTTPAPSPAPAQPPAPQPQVVRRGTEAGNSYDMTVIGGEGQVGFSGGVPLYLFMPLPTELPDSLYQNIPDKRGLPGTSDERKADFAKVYVYNAATRSWRLPNWNQPDYDARIMIWPILEDAGYSLKSAEYKAGKSLRPVEISFTILPYSQGAALSEVKLTRSSGYGDIDEAILAGLRHPTAKFRNDSERKISGTFSYTFE